LDMRTVVGMLVRQQQFRRRHDGARFVAVHSGHLVGPFPALTHEPEAEGADVQVLSGGLDRAGLLLADPGGCRRTRSPALLHVYMFPSGGYPRLPPWQKCLPACQVPWGGGNVASGPSIRRGSARRV